MQVNDYEENYITGWVKMYRSLSSKAWYKKSNYVHLWVHILLKANHKQNEFWFNGKTVKVGRGQFITGRKELSKETGIAPTTIERILKTFESEQQIGQQKTNRNRLITVLNYHLYQLSGQQNGQQADNKRTTDGQQADTNKNDNNIKKEKNEERAAFDFLKSNHSYVLETFIIQNKKNIDDWDRMIDNFNDTVEIEKLEYNGKILLARLRKYCRNWISNQQTKKTKEDKISF